MAVRQAGTAEKLTWIWPLTPLVCGRSIRACCVAQRVWRFPFITILSIVVTVVFVAASMALFQAFMLERVRTGRRTGEIVGKTGIVGLWTVVDTGCFQAASCTKCDTFR